MQYDRERRYPCLNERIFKYKYEKYTPNDAE